MNVMEMFYSIQGEGKYMGTPVIFIRTAGCSLHCPWCDTAQSWKFQDNEGMTFNQILKDVQRLSTRCKTIVITGGEPTEQRDLLTITEQLKFEGYDVHLETNGTGEVPRGYFTHVVCSPKPGANYKVLQNADELKYVVNVDSDINQICPAWVRTAFAGRIWLQPMDEKDPARNEANFKKCLEIAMKCPEFRVGIQLHKVYGVQ